MSKLKVKFNHETEDSMECLGINLSEFTEKVDSIYERLMPMDKDAEDWDVKKTSEVAEIMLEELPDEYVALMFMRAVHADVQKRLKLYSLKSNGLDKLADLLEQLSSSLNLESEDEPERESSKKSKDDDDIEDIVKQIKNGLGS